MKFTNDRLFIEMMLDCVQITKLKFVDAVIRENFDP